MGLVDLVLLGLCANLTCPGDKIRDTAAIQEEIIRNQARLLRNYTLKIATVHNPPLSSITEVDGILQFGGIAYDVIEILRKKFNFEYEIVKPPEDSLNVEDNGIVGMLSRNEVDVAAAFLPAFPYISNHLHFSISLSKAEWVVLMKRPPVSATGSGLLAPFTFQVWLLILVSLFAVGPIIYLLILLQTRLCRTDDNPVYPLPSCVWFVYGALLKQGSTLSPRTGSHSEFLEEDGTSILENWVRRRDYMYIGERPIVDHLMYRDYLSKVDPNIAESDRCTFVVTTWTVTENLRAFAYSPNFPFIDLFNNILMHLVESGIVMYSLREGLPDTQICPLDLGSKERQLQNTDLIMTYYIVVGGFIVSTIAFLIELLCTKCNGKIKSNKQSRADTLFTVAEKKGRMDENRLFPPPPPYHALFKPPFPHSENATTKNVNGRDYWVIKSVDGNTRLIPIRAPSAFLFQYDN
ncbi:ionotropic glutamate receptor [Holotrichia oblita]|uniref:Ionotropic glutamate receptor n=1 Tax=Holotrichia oblita TaxID=644536 RepID=A0ACB9T6K0_HOLOL|nr:ionotropic glutamate receptor [Holotrichia oblita]